MAKAIGYVTVKPTYDDRGEVVKIQIDSAYQKFPTSLTGGAIALELVVEIPDEVFEPTQVNIFVSDEHIKAKKPITVFVVSADEYEE